MADTIHHLRTIHGMSHEDWVRARLGAKRQLDAMPERQGETVLPARIDAGRWLVDCPGEHCTGAELADPEDLRFFCTTCLNADVGGQWLRVAFPRNREAIETRVLALPPRERFWRPA